MNTLNIFRYIKEVIESNVELSRKINGNIFPVAVLRDVPLPYVIQSASLQADDSSKDGTFERTVQSRIYVFADNVDEVIGLADEIIRTIKNGGDKNYFRVSEIDVESWDFIENEQIFGGEIIFNIKTI